MRSDRESIIAALDAIEAGYKALAASPMEALSRSEGQALLVRLDKLDKQRQALDRTLLGRLISAGDPAGGEPWAGQLSRKLRISAGEAQRRIAEAS